MPDHDELPPYRSELVDDVLVLSGELDDDGLAALESDLEEHSAGFTTSLVLELSGVTLLPSSAIRVLALAHERASTAGVALRLVAESDSFAHRVLQICAFPHEVVDVPAGTAPGRP